MPKSLSSYALYALITILVVSLYIGDFSGLQKLQWKLDDLMYSFRGEEKAVSEIVKVEIDDQSCRTFGEWPWSYNLVADLVAVCNSGKPRVMLINFDLPPRASEDTLGHTQVLANQVSWVENAVFTYDIALAEFSQQRMSKPRHLFKSSIQTDAELGILNSENAINIRRPFLPSSIITQYADGMGFSYIDLETDRHVRWVPMVGNYDGYCYPSATLLTAAMYLGYGPADITIKAGQSVDFGHYSVPTDEKGRLFLNYNPPGKTFTTLTAEELLREQVNPTQLNDKIVIMGVTASGGEDQYQTPVTDRMSRTELSANLIENIIHSNYITRLDFSTGLNLLLLLGFGAFCAVILPRISLLYRMVVLFICMFILINLCFILFNSYNLLLEPFYIGLEIVLFMIASPLVDESRRHGKQAGLFAAFSSKMKKEETPPKPPSEQAIPVKTVTQSQDDPELQETEHIESNAIAVENSEPRTEATNAAPPETRAMDETPPPSATPPDSDRPVENEPSPSVAPPQPAKNVDPAITPEKKMTSSPLSGSSPDIESIKNLGRYQVVDVVGKGAMGTVFKGVDPAINRPVALKTIRLDFVSDESETEELRDRLMREARAAGKLSHPNLVTIYDIGSENNLHYIAMEYLEGQTLENLIKRKVQFSYKIIANIISQICLGLQYAHDQGIVHRDIKPANIMVLPDYSVKVMDFGIARVDSSSMTRTGIAMGTPNYIAPELLQGQPVDRRCDIFSLGVVIYELLTGVRPFRGENLTSLIYTIINEKPKDPSQINDNIPLLFDHITMKALSKDPKERFQKASDLMGALSDFVGSFGGSKKVNI